MTLLRASPPCMACLADACKCAPRLSGFIAVDISFLFIVLELALFAAVGLRLRRVVRSDQRARWSLMGSFTAFIVF